MSRARWRSTERVRPSRYEVQDLALEKAPPTQGGRGARDGGQGGPPYTLRDSVATHDLDPDVTVLLDVDLEVARARLGDQMDRIEGAGAEFHQRGRNGYLELAAQAPGRWLVIDAGGTVDEVAARVDTAIDGWLGQR